MRNLRHPRKIAENCVLTVVVATALWLLLASIPSNTAEMIATSILIAGGLFLIVVGWTR